MKVTKREPQLWRLGICLLFLQRRAGKTPGAMMSSCTSNAIRSRGCFGVSDAFAAFSPAMINLIRTWFVDFFQNSVSLLHSTRGLQTMSLFICASYCTLSKLLTADNIPGFKSSFPYKNTKKGCEKSLTPKTGNELFALSIRLQEFFHFQPCGLRVFSGVMQ